jgi:uncharacterized membrane protein YhiD involved in acid resistance
MERELSHKPAGIRTNMLIGLGAALFTIISFELLAMWAATIRALPRDPWDHERFDNLCCGQHRHGRRRWLPVTGIFTALLWLGSLVIIGHLEQRFGLQGRLMNFRVAMSNDASANDKVRAIVDDLSVQRGAGTLIRPIVAC